MNETEVKKIQILFHASFSNVRKAYVRRLVFLFSHFSHTPQQADGNGDGSLMNSEFQVFSSSSPPFNVADADVHANKPRDAPTNIPWAGDLPFRHPVLSNETDCLTIVVRIMPQSVAMFHSRDAQASYVTSQFGSFYDVANATNNEDRDFWGKNNNIY